MIASGLCLLAFAGCDSGNDADAPGSGYQAEIIRTSYGVAHITAADFGSLGYGEGYAAAEDHVCNISRSLLEARGELARHFGAGDGDKHSASDAVVRALDIRSQALAALRQQDSDSQNWLRGYADGYNRYLGSVQGNRVGSWCDGEEWLQAITDLDLMARMVLVAQTLPRMAGALIAAQPPVDSAPPVDTAVDTAVDEGLLALAADAAALDGMGSNAWAFGKARSANGRGLLLGNPHYPWYGDSRFWEKHLTIPGVLDVYGVHLLGAPGVAVGFNRGVGWSHTVSASQRLVFYQLQLVPGKPTHYRYEDGERALRQVKVAVPVRQDDGSLANHEHTLYFSHYGPMLTLSGMPWTETTAFTARDANADNYSLLGQWRAMSQAEDMDAFIDAHRQWNAMPWVNTIAASADGRAVYLDNSTVGRLSEEAIGLWRKRLAADELTAQVYRERGFVLLDGSDSRFEWQNDGVVPVAGTVPFERRPMLEREDYVFNSNDSYWLSNALAPLSGYSPLYGPAATARSLRTRMNVKLIEEGEFSISRIQQTLFANESLAARLLQPGLMEACADVAELAEACAAIGEFNGRFNEDSKGALLFREWLVSYPYADSMRAGDLFAVPFDPARPVATPNTLADPELALQRLAKAAELLESAGYAVDAPLGAAQFAYRGERRIPLHGGNGYEGVANLMVSDIPEHPIAPPEPTPVAGSPLLTDAGYPIIHGSSFILALGFDDDGPVAEALLTYSQSGNPESPHFSDQTDLYRNKQWRPALFDRAAVEADMQSRLELIGPRR
ncbi:acylase [Haliea sp. E1-2-M8]|uniref:acylase n=1 Tax=Haliea sp. E1-2-M8 TaxID=3064706 RepID=UPI00271DC64A|nr:acylase [Haliea sp. E1-2-M8]MDO8862149.1 acylase [Haliea sp. E1-2-M8]